MRRCGEIKFLEEMSTNDYKSCLRILGELTFLDQSKRVCQLHDRGTTVPVELSLIALDDVQIGDMIFIIGDVELMVGNVMHISFWKAKFQFPSLQECFAGEFPQSQFYLKARVYAKANGLDFDLYKKLVIVRRKYLAR